MVKPAMPHVDARYHKHPFKKHVNSNKSRPTMPYVDARFRRHTLKEHINNSKVKNFSEIISIIISEKIFWKYYLRRDSAAAKILYI